MKSTPLDRWGVTIRLKIVIVLLLLGAAAAAYYRLIYAPQHTTAGEPAYVLPTSLEVMNTTAAVRRVVGRFKAGDRVEVIARTAHWSEIRMPRGGTGWVESSNLLDAPTYQRGEALLKSLETFPAQATGHTSTVTNLRLDPARDSIVLSELAENQPLEIFGRRVVDRPSVANAPPSGKSRAHDVWYLVRANSRAGWVFGRLVDLDVPAGISAYAEGVNMVAWLVLRTVDDSGKAVPEYLVADRIGAADVDFNHIRVFTWWVKNHKYVTAYVESNLSGYFPIESRQMTDPAYYAQPSPYFRLRLLDPDGRRYQKVYGLFDTIIREVGTVDGWDSTAMPARARASRTAGGRGTHARRRQPRR
jgi:Bacterial SH3 domain